MALRNSAKAVCGNSLSNTYKRQLLREFQKSSQKCENEKNCEQSESLPHLDTAPYILENVVYNYVISLPNIPPMKKTLITLCSFALLAFLPTVAFAQVSDAEKAEGFVSIFNGKDLTEWEGNPVLWKVENGAIVGTTTADGPGKITYNQFLVWKGGDVEDFVLRFDIKLSRAGNSGMQYRSWMNPDATKPFSVFGYQADFDGEHRYSGILYGENFRAILCQRGQETVVGDDHKPKEVKRFAEDEALKKELKVEDWNAYEVTAKGFTFTNKINGHVMSVCTDEDKEVRKSKGILAVQIHQGPPMTVEVKNIRIKKIPVVR
jgi:hypothetical protein